MHVTCTAVSCAARTFNTLTGCQTIDKIGRFCLLIKSANKSCRLSCKNRSILSSNTEDVLFSTIKSANFLDIGHDGDRLQCEMNIYFSYLFCLLLCNVYFRSLDAEKITQVSFCYLHSAGVILYEVANDKIGRVFNDFIGRYSRANKPRPRKVTNFIDRLTSALGRCFVTV